MNIVFMGTPAFCIPSLEEIYRSYNLVGVVTQPDRAANRGQKIFKSPVKRFAEKHNIPVLQPAKVRKNDDFYKELKDLNPDMIIVIAYGQILPKRILEIPEYGCINIHGSLLPLYRGAAPIQFAILNNDKVTGVTSMLMNTKMDEGDMLVKLECEIDQEDNAGLLHDKLAELSARCCVETVEGLFSKKINPEIQDHSKASYTRLIKKEDGKIDWNNSSEKVFNTYRAMNPWPGTFSYIGDEYFKFLKIEIDETDTENSQPGVVTKLENDSFSVACLKGSIRILEIQTPGKKAMKVREFLNGNNSVKTGIKFDC